MIPPAVSGEETRLDPQPLDADLPNPTVVDGSRYKLPRGMRPATLGEREIFYRSEFDLSKVSAWLVDHPSPLFAVKLGKVTGIFRPELEIDRDATILLTQTPLVELRESLLYYLPESVYYDRNLYRQLHVEDLQTDGNVLGQELCFDVDPENMDCPVCGSLEARLDRGEMYTFCVGCFEQARKAAVALFESLKGEFKKLVPVYSGRGFHIHVRDRGAALLSRAERQEISKALLDQGIEHDEWVASGSSRLIRLPHSLHSLVSRVVTPLSPERLEDFNPLKEARPAYL